MQHRPERSASNLHGSAKEVVFSPRGLWSWGLRNTSTEPTRVPTAAVGKKAAWAKVDVNLLPCPGQQLDPNPHCSHFRRMSDAGTLGKAEPQWAPLALWEPGRDMGGAEGPR